MRIVIEANEAIMAVPGGKSVGSIYGIHVSTESCDFFKDTVRKAADLDVEFLKKNRNGGAA